MKQITIIAFFMLYVTTTMSETEHVHEHADSTEDNTENIWTAIAITSSAGFASFLGALAIFCIKKEHMNVLPCSLAFAAGVTVYLSFVTLIPESIEQFHKCVDTESKTATLPELYTLLCVILGLLITFSMETLFHHLGVDTHNHDDHTEAPCEDQANMTDSESQRADNIILFDSEVISKPVNVSE
eukprot:938365_1